LDFLKGRVKSVKSLTSIINKIYKTNFKKHQIRYRVDQLYQKTFGTPHDDADYFVKMAEDDVKKNGGYFQMEMGNESKLKNVIYISNTMLSYAKKFIDIVLVDAKYKRNRFNMPLVSLVGINNFGHTILLGFGLVCNETIPTYVWFFSNLKLAWDGLKPLNFIADECESINEGINL